ncbi:hypothetical protein SNE40_005378 [Patella caerulea]|uniref:Uncharacterized protein n=1 Tax=Patella caerulea TaxID=87958 RepID=A0AAN8QBC0_PATCE
MIHLEDECERLIDIEQSIKQEAKVLAFVDSWWEEATIVQRSCDPDRGIFFDRWWEEATFQQRSCDPDRGIFFDSWWEDATIVQRSCDPDRSPDQSNEIGNKPYHNKVRNVLNSLFGEYFYTSCFGILDNFHILPLITCKGLLLTRIVFYYLCMDIFLGKPVQDDREVVDEELLLP